MSRFGLEKEWEKICTKLEKKFRSDSEELTRMIDRVYRGQVNRLRNWIKSYERYLIRFYHDQGIEPVSGFIPVDGKRENNVFCITGMIDSSTLSFVTGDFEDVVTALEYRNSWAKHMAETYQRNRRIAKNMLALPGVNRDLKSRLELVVSGSVDRTLLKARSESA